MRKVMRIVALSASLSAFGCGQAVTNSRPPCRALSDCCPSTSVEAAAETAESTRIDTPAAARAWLEEKFVKGESLFWAERGNCREYVPRIVGESPLDVELTSRVGLDDDVYVGQVRLILGDGGGASYKTSSRHWRREDYKSEWSFAGAFGS